MPGKSNGDYPKCPLRMQTLHMFVVGKGDIVRSQSPDTDAHTRQSLLLPSWPNPDSCLTGFHNKPACGCSAYWFILGPPSVDSNSKTNLLAPKTSCWNPCSCASRVLPMDHYTDPWNYKSPGPCRKSKC